MAPNSSRNLDFFVSAVLFLRASVISGVIGPPVVNGSGVAAVIARPCRYSGRGVSSSSVGNELDRRCSGKYVSELFEASRPIVFGLKFAIDPPKLSGGL
jgi:hypothetical protein